MGNRMSNEPSGTSKKFDLEGTLGVLEKLAHEQARTPEDIAAIEAAAYAIHFIQMQGKLDDYRDYLQDVEKAAERACRVVASFGNMSEAFDWLRAHPDPRFGTRVEIAGSPYYVTCQRKEVWFFVPAPRLPSLEELLAEDSEET